MRLHPRRALRIVLVVSMVLFVILNFHMIPDTLEDNEHFQDYHMMGGGIHAVQDMHVQLGNTQHVGVQSDSRGAAEPSSYARLVHPKIVIAAGSNQTQVTTHLHACSSTGIIMSVHLSFCISNFVQKISSELVFFVFVL